MMLLCVVYLLAGLLIAGISWPLIVGKVPPNSLYGFRTPRTLRDPAVWYPANAYAGRWLFGCGVVIALAAIVLYFVPSMDIATYGYAMLAVTLVTIGSGLIQSFRFLSRLPSQ
jgi:uncharacterized membrane protein